MYPHHPMATTPSKSLPPPPLPPSLAGPAFNYQERWARLADRLLDEEPLAVGATAAALCELLEAAAPTADGGAATAAPLPGLAGGVLGASPGAGAGACGTASLYITRQAAGDVAARVAAALGPVLETCAFVPAPDQVGVFEWRGWVVLKWMRVWRWADTGHVRLCACP